MYQPAYPGNWNQPNLQEYYHKVATEKHAIRRDANIACFVTAGVMVGMPLFAGLLVRLLVGLGYSSIDPTFYGYSPEMFYVLNGVYYILACMLPAVVFFLAIRRRQETPAAYLPISRVNVLYAAGSALFAFAVCLLSNIPASWAAAFQESIGFPVDNPPDPLNNSFLVQALYFTTVAIIPPLVEEVVFRGIVLHSLLRYGEAFAILGSAFAFALFHGNFVQMVFAFLCGLALGLIVVRTRNLWISILVHFLNNSNSVMITLLERNYGTELANLVYSSVMGLVLLLGLLSLILLIVRDKGYFRFRGPAMALSGGQKCGAFFSNAGCIILILYALYESITRLVGG